MVNRLSVDFTLPEAGIGAHVPISVLPKWPPLYDFDFRGADGKPLPLLTSAQNGVIDEALLLALVQKISPASLSDPGFAKALTSLTRGPETHLGEAFESFRLGLAGDFDDPEVERLLDIAAMLTDATFLWYPAAAGEPGSRTSCKVEYLIPGLNIESWHRRLLRSLSWTQPAEYIPLWHIGADANFHAELEAPPVLTIRSVEPSYYWFTEGGPAVEVEAATEEAEKPVCGPTSTPTTRALSRTSRLPEGVLWAPTWWPRLPPRARRFRRCSRRPWSSPPSRPSSIPGGVRWSQPPIAMPRSRC